MREATKPEPFRNEGIHGEHGIERAGAVRSCWGRGVAEWRRWKDGQGWAVVGAQEECTGKSGTQDDDQDVVPRSSRVKRGVDCR